MFGWTRLTRKATSAKPQTGLKFRPTLDGFEDRLAPAAAVPGLGAAGQFAVLGMNGGKVELCRATVDGNLGLGAQETTKFRQSTVTGQLVAHSSAQANTSGLTVNGGVVQQSLSQAASDAAAASAAYAALPPTQSFGTVNDDLTITGTGGTNVLDINNLNYGSGDILRLAGGANDVFVINVTGEFRFQSGAIQLAGVTPNHVVFNVPTSGTDVRVAGENSVFSGTILAPNRKVEDCRTGNFNGAIIARSVEVRSGDAVHAAAFTPPASQTGSPATISGRVVDNIGLGVTGAKVTLSGTDFNGNPVSADTWTDEDGPYSFNVAPGTYRITISALPTGYIFGSATAGQGADVNGTAGTNSISGITLGSADTATGFDFAVVQTGF